MNRKELLRERYEDALFALLMEEVATAEGEKALEENLRLQNDPAARVPESVDSKCRQTIHRYFARRRRLAFQTRSLRVAAKAMVAVGILSTLFFTAFATSETVRLNTLNLVTEVFEEKTSFHFADNTGNEDPQIFAEWLPDGFLLSEEESGNEGPNSWVVYRNNNCFIHIMRYNGNKKILSLDTEDAQVYTKEINKKDATFIIKDGELQLIWGIEDDAAFINIIGVGVTEEDFIHVASTVKY